ncbi:NAD-dependent epimerase/dehydratase family protein [Rhodanobacter sp. OK091]|uniref:NAD-dependent epimerase/dehydratase family protein n=1 Tax=Rhodanobacter sp. OK091 TaxID=1881037 RepID=UPI00091C6005|nr:NAD-dependent epimerase/dehydratase family protein [Rhodanobacter sp. OK091]SHM28633.1 Nucleoside-diphosphate-sugar epimerase [Rhodanobacter sp. OK091]
MSERVLLAGCGDLGLRVAQRLLARGDEVWALRRQQPMHDGDGIHWLRGDLTLPETLRGWPPDITQLVYLPTPDRRDAAAYRATFVDGLRHLLDALGHDRLQRVLLVSSSAVYGEHGGDWVDEDTPPAPPGFNGEVLLEAERWLAAQSPVSIVLRLAGLYGPGRMQWLERLRAGQVVAPRTLPHWANRIHVDDAAAAVVHLLQLDDPLPLYLGVDNTPLPLDVLYDHLAGLIGARPADDGPAPVGVGSKRLSNARLRASGFVPQWPDARDGYAALFDQ